MIIVKLQGGLGNQMFQYAAGKRIAHIHQTKLKLDLNSFENDLRYEFSLKHFNIEAVEASRDEIEAWSLGNMLQDRYRKRILWYLSWLYPRHFREKENKLNSGECRLCILAFNRAFVVVPTNYDSKS